MPNPIIVNSTYAGEFAGKYIAPAVLAANTIAENAIDLMPNIAFQSPVRPMILDDIVKDATCDFTKVGDITLNERMLTPKPMAVNLEFCKKTLFESWEAAQMGYSQWKVIPKKFNDFLLGYVGASISEFVEQNIWDGTAGADQFPGFYHIASNDTDAISVTSTATEVTADNVLEELGLIASKISSKLYSNKSKKMYLSIPFARAYVEALGGFAANGTGANGVDNKGTLWFNGQPLLFNGIPIHVANGLGSKGTTAVDKDRVMVSFRENFVFGTGLMSDLQKVQVLDMTPLDGSDNVRVIVKFSGGVQYGISEDVIYYKHA